MLEPGALANFSSRSWQLIVLILNKQPRCLPTDWHCSLVAWMPMACKALIRTETLTYTTCTHTYIHAQPYHDCKCCCYAHWLTSILLPSPPLLESFCMCRERLSVFFLINCSSVLTLGSPPGSADVGLFGEGLCSDGIGTWWMSWLAVLLHAAESLL